MARKPLVGGLIATLSWVALTTVVVAQPQVLRLDSERDNISPLGVPMPGLHHAQEVKEKQDPCLPTIQVTQARIAARSAEVSLSMAKNELASCKTRAQLGMHAAKAALDKCNLKVKEAESNCAKKSGEQLIELGESSQPGADAAKQESEELHRECAALAKEIEGDLEQVLLTKKSLGEDVRLDESHCTKLNKDLELSMDHRCCTGKQISGCPLVGVQGNGGAEKMQCRHFDPTGPQSACYYSEVYFDKDSETYKGRQTVQNQARTNYVQCTTFEYAKNVQEIKRWTHVGFNASGDGAEEWRKWHSDDDFVNIPDPFTEEDAKDRLKKAGNVAKVEDLGSDNSTQLDDMGTTSAEPAGNRDKWAQAAEATTSIAVHALVKSTSQCTMCGKSVMTGNRSDLLDLNAPDVSLPPKCDQTKNQRSECVRKKVVQCQKICFLIGKMGLKSESGGVRAQGFREEECPVKQHMSTQRQGNATRVPEIATRVGGNMDENWELVPNGILTNASAHYGKVTLETIVDIELPKFATVEEQKEHLRRKYGSEDVDLKQCCFPGCNIPQQVLAGKFYGADNPWYWYDREITLSTGAGMQFLYQ